MNSIIVKNSIICNNCKEEIVSEHRHDFKMCSCGNCGVDGGFDYLRRIGDNWIGTSIETNDISVVREHLKRNGTTLLKDMETDWIENVIIYEEEKRPNNPLLPYYKAELKFRKNGKKD